MFINKPEQRRRSALAIAGCMCGLWFLGVIALFLVPSDAGSRNAEKHVTFRHQATGVTYAYQDATGQFTVYIRGSQRTLTP